MNATTTQEAQTLELVEAETNERRLPAVQQGGALAANSPAAMMLQALSQGASLEQVEKMMDLQDRWERREAEKAFNDDFAAFRGENVIIPRSKHVNRGKAGSFMQAEYDEVCRGLSPALSKHGFGFNHEATFAMRNLAEPGQEPIHVGWVTVKCTLTHRLGHTKVETLEGPQDDQSANSPVQNMQSTATFLKRQSLLNITGTATGGEDDESRQRGRGGDDDAPRDAEDRDLQAGEDAADHGMKSLTEWWSKLGNKQRSALNSDFGRLRKHAQAVDQEPAVRELLIRCSSIGKIMTAPRLKGEVLSEGAKTYIRQLAAESIFGVDFEVSSKQLEKGIEVEPDSIALLNLVRGTSLVKNAERRTDDFFSGECDLFNAARRHGHDLKSSWSIATFPITTEACEDKLYEYQMRGYMRLWDADSWSVDYALVNTPEHLIGYEPQSLHFVDHIPPHHRITSWAINRDLEIEVAMVEKVKHARDYYREVIKEFDRIHPDFGTILCQAA